MNLPRSRHATLFSPASRFPFALAAFLSVFVLANLGADEPLPPDILSAKIVAENDQEAIVEVVLKPSAGGEVELSIPKAAHPAVAGKARQAEMRLAKNANARTDRYRCDCSHGKYRRVSFRAVVKNDAGEIVADVTKVIELNPDKKPKPARGLERVPVVIEGANGRKVVEYMTRAEAARRKLTPATPSAPAPSEEEHSEENENDAPEDDHAE